jgi:threonyl-tRNA synthetase
MAFLIERYAGAFPLWLSPVQVVVLPVSQKHAEYAQEVLGKLREAHIRAEINADDESLGKRIREAKLMKVPYLFVVGDKEMEAGTVNVESRRGDEGAKAIPEITQILVGEIRNRAVS